jgi:hypothetical protein
MDLIQKTHKGRARCVQGRGLVRLALAIIGVPTCMMAGPFDGVYKQIANAECALVGVDGGALEIKDAIFYGVNVECRMTDPVDVVDMDATLYTMQCSGDGTVWTERAMVMDTAAKDGIIMVWNGYAFVYERCADSAG